jgi:hypothetical protein
VAHVSLFFWFPSCFFLTRIAPENVLSKLHPMDVTCKNVSPPSVGVLGL